MSKARIDQMLQDCLDGYEAGLTPEECLSAYPKPAPGAGAASAPGALVARRLCHQPKRRVPPSSPRTADVLGRPGCQPGAGTPSPAPDFLLQERTRFLNVAGGIAQEALRDVPPPRLAFWVNARRRLLDTAAATTPAPARRFGGMLRYSLSAAVVALAIGAITVASLGGGSS